MKETLTLCLAAVMMISSASAQDKTDKTDKMDKGGKMDKMDKKKSKNSTDKMDDKKSVDKTDKTRRTRCTIKRPAIKWTTKRPATKWTSSSRSTLHFACRAPVPGSGGFFCFCPPEDAAGICDGGYEVESAAMTREFCANFRRWRFTPKTSDVSCGSLVVPAQYRVSYRAGRGDFH